MQELPHELQQIGNPLIRQPFGLPPSPEGEGFYFSISSLKTGRLRWIMS